MDSRSIVRLTLGFLALSGCASWDGHYTSAVRARNEIGDRCNALRDTWRADQVAGLPASSVESDRQRMMVCVSEFRDAQANVEEAWRLHVAAVAQLGDALQSAGQNAQDAGAAYGRAAASLSPPPSPPAPLPPPESGSMYQHPQPPHGCIALVPVPGPGLNPCPSP